MFEIDWIAVLLIAASALFIVAGVLAAMVLDMKEKLTLVEISRDDWRARARDRSEDLQKQAATIGEQGKCLAAMKAAVKALEIERDELIDDKRLLNHEIDRYRAMPRVSGPDLLMALGVARGGVSAADKLVNDAIAKAKQPKS